MEKARKKELAQVYAERDRHIGVFAVRCPATGDVWTGTSQTLEKQESREWFILKHGASTNRVMQAAWKAHGEGAFTFEILEEVDTEGMTPLGLRDALKAREKHWRETLGAAAVA